MPAPSFIVAFDNGDSFVVPCKSRDYLKLERDGINLSELGSMESGYTVAHVALLRMERTQEIEPSDPIPATVEGLMDVADIEPEERNSGEAEGQAALTG